LGRIYDERAVETTLSAGITASTPANGGTISVVNTEGYPSPTGGDTATFVIDYDDAALIETISYTGKTGTTFTGVTRGVGKNGAKAHASGAKVRHGAADVDLEVLGDAVRLTGAQTIAGVKTFSSRPLLPASSPTTDNEAVRKKYVDDLNAAHEAKTTAVHGIADTAQLALKNAVGMTLIGEASGAGASLTVSSIPATYKHLMVFFAGRSDTASGGTPAYLRFNGDTGANYDREGAAQQNGAQYLRTTRGAAQVELDDIPGASASANRFGTGTIQIPDYAGAQEKNCHASVLRPENNITLMISTLHGHWRSVAAITSVSLTPAAGSFIAGSRLTVYGLA
jgi:hypothetical protein